MILECDTTATAAERTLTLYRLLGIERKTFKPQPVRRCWLLKSRVLRGSVLNGHEKDDMVLSQWVVVPVAALAAAAAVLVCADAGDAAAVGNVLATS